MYRRVTGESLVKPKKVMDLAVLWSPETMTDRSNTFNSTPSMPWMFIPFASTDSLKVILVDLVLNKEFLGHRILSR